MQSSRWAVAGSASPASAPTTQQPQEATAINEQTYVTQDPMHDEFAQTVDADDLFDDDYTPITQPTVEEQPRPVEAPIHIQPQSAATQRPGPAASRHAVPSAPRAPKDRGRNRRGGRGGNQGVTPTGKDDAAAPEASQAPAQSDTESKVPDGTPTGPAAALTEAEANTEKKDGAVRGDRTATGGPKIERMTEQQLTEKLAAMRLKNAELTAAHERSVRDEAAYTKREAIAAEQSAQKRKEERQNRQAMMGERERNRQRKINALGGREWDAEKGEGQFERDADEREGTRGGRARRGAHGAVVGPPAPAQQPDLLSSENGHENGNSRREYTDRGRGGRARGRGGRGRGNGLDGHSGRPQQGFHPKQSIPSSTDFPDLPASTTPKDKGDAGPAPQLSFPKDKAKIPATSSEAQGNTSSTTDAAGSQTSTPSATKLKTEQLKEKDKFGFSPITPGTEKKSWADQVEGATSPL